MFALLAKYFSSNCEKYTHFMLYNIYIHFFDFEKNHLNFQSTY